MSNVVTVARTTKQPYGGFLRVRDTDKVQYDDGVELYSIKDGQVAPQLIGLAVDYLTRINLGFDMLESFEISLRGARIIDQEEEAKKLLSEMDMLNDQTIINACKLVGFDSVYRAGIHTYRPIEYIYPEAETIEDIRTMVTRSVRFFEDKGPVTMNGMTFEGGYTSKVQTGDADFLTADALWDLKVLKNPIRSRDTLQILIYYLLGLNSIHQEEFKSITKLGFYNPRLNISYTKNIHEIEDKVLDQVREEVIGY